MPRKTLLTAAIVTLLLGVVALAPQVPVVRNGLLGVLLRAAEGQGITVTYQRSAGNLWRSVSLYGVEVDGPGSTVQLDQVRLDYFLPSLLGGELPLDVEIDGARGAVDLRALTTGMTTGSPGGQGGGLVPRVQLGKVHLSGLELNASQVPFTLPDAQISDLSVQSSDGTLRIAGEVTTAQGSAHVTGVLTPGTLDFTGFVDRADVTLAQHWWPGAKGGSVSGPIRVKNGAVVADLKLTNGSVDDLGLSANAVNGTVQLDFPIITAAVSGQGMGGPVTATGEVDIAAMRFTATGRATPALAEAAAWLLRGTLEGQPFDITGTAQVDLTVSGWQTVDARGSATGAGAVNGVPLDDLAARFSYGAPGDLRVDSSALFGGGRVTLSIAPGARGTSQLQVAGTDVSLAGFGYAGVAPGGQLTAVALDYAMGRSATARLTAAWSGAFGADPVALNLDARLDPDGWQAFVSGHTSAYAAGPEGVDVSGALVLAHDRVEGGLNAANLAVPGLTGPASLALKASGPLDDVALSLELGGPGPVSPAVAGVALDLRGQAAARYAASAFGPITGRFGPVSLAAEVDTGSTGPTVTGSWALDVVNVAAADGVAGSISARSGRIEYATGALSVTADAQLGATHLGPVTVAPTAVGLNFGLADAGGTLAWNLRGHGQHLALAVGSATPLAATVAGLPVRLAGIGADEPWAALSGAVEAVAGGGYELDAQLLAGNVVAGFELPTNLALAATVPPDLGSLHASGAVGSVPVNLTADWTATQHVVVSVAGIDVVYDLTRASWTASGNANVATLARALGLEAEGLIGGVALDLAGVGSRVTGPASITLTRPVTLTLDAVGNGESVTLDLAGDVGGLVVTGAGSASLAEPNASTLTVTVGPLAEIILTPTGATGNGVIAEQALGPLALSPTPWALEAEWAGLAGSVTVGAARLTARLVDGAFELAGGLATSIEYAGAAYDVVVTPGAGTAVLDAALAAFPASATVTNRATGEQLVVANGSLGNLAVTLGVGAGELTAALPDALRPDWRLTGSGTVDLLAGPSYRANLSLLPGPTASDQTPVTARLTGVGAHADLNLDGAGLYLSSEAAPDGGRLRLRASGAALDRYLPAGAGGDLSGTLVLEAGAWSGALTANLTADLTGPLAATVTLTGAGDELRVAATATGPAASSMAARGTLLPRLHLEAQASALDNWLSADLLYDDGLAGRLLTKPLDVDGLASVPAVDLAVDYDPATGALGLTQTGNTGAWRFEGGLLSGALTVPIATAAGTVEVVATASGSLAAAQVTAQLSGAVGGDLTASAASGVVAALSVSADSLLASVPALQAVSGLVTEPLTLSAALATSGAWTATAQAAVKSGATPTIVRADLHGDLLDYSGAVLVQRDGAALATAEVAGSGADLRAALDLGAVDWTAIGEAFGAELQVNGTGWLTVASQPLAVGLTLDLSGRVGGNEVRVHGSAPNDLHLTLSGPAGELNGLLAWTAAAGAPPQARLEGSFGETAVSLLVGATADGGGNLNARYGAAELTATLGPDGEGAGRGISVHLQAPPASAFAYGVVADSELTLQGSDLSVTSLNASITGLLPDAVTLQAAGALTPGLDLDGSLTTPSLPDAATVSLLGSDLTLTWRELQVSTTTDLASVALRGSASNDDVAAILGLLPDLPPALADVQAAVHASDLSWSRSDGFSGGLQATASSTVGALAEPLHLDVNAVGDGQLELDASAWFAGGDASAGAAPAARAVITLAADPLTDPSLSGQVDLAVELQQLLAAATAAPTSLSAYLTVGGTLTSPELHGTATLAGAIAATGPLAYAGGAASANLTGPNVTATFEAHQLNGGQLTWQGRLRATDFDLAPWAPQVAEPRLNLAAAVSSAGVTVDELVLTAPNSRVTGGGKLTLGAAASADFALSAQLNLADVSLTDAPLVGTLRGPLSLTAPDLNNLGSAAISGSLDASGLGVVGFDGSVSGRLSVGGTVDDPSITANLAGDGRVTGTLAASGRPAGGVLNLTSDLAVGQFATDLRASLHAGVASAAGSARYGEAVLLISGGDNGEGPTVILTGAGRLAGFSAAVAADLGSARLSGDLSAVSSSLAGAVTVALDASGDGPWLQMSVVDANAGGIDLGNIQLISPTGLGRLTLTSEHLTGQFTTATGEWNAALTALEVGAGISVNAAASGTLSSLQLRGSAAGPDLDLVLALAAGDGSPMTVALSGSAYGGAVDVGAERGTAGGSGSWTGTATVAGAELAGMALSATGTVIGEGALPQLVLSTKVDGSIAAVGRATISATGVTLDQIVSGAPLSQSLRVQGRLWPTTDLTVASLAEEPTAGQSINLPVTSQVRLRTVAGLGLRASGTMRLDLGPARLALGGQDSAPQLTAQVTGLPQLRAAATLTAPDLIALVRDVVTNGLRFEGADAVRGGLMVALTPEPTVTLEDFGMTLAGIDIGASGTLDLNAAALAGEVVLATDLPLTNGDLGAASAAVTEYTLPWTLVADAGEWRLAYEGDLGTIDGMYAPSTAPDAVSLNVNLNLSGGVVRADLDHRAGQLTGSMHVEGLRLAPQGLGSFEVNAEGSIADGLVGGSATLDSDAGRLTLSGSWGLAGLLPAAFTAGAPSGGRIEARLRSLEVSLIPAVHERAPFLTGSITGVLQLRDGLVFGQLVSLEVAAGDARSSAELAVSGSLSSLDATLRVKGGTFNANLSGARLSGSGRFERFPAQFVAQAVVGPSDVTADVTGVLRFDLPLIDIWSGYLRLATEEVRLERAGVPTIGNLSLTFDQGALMVEHAEFAGLGSWEAQGQLREDNLDFHLEAVEADFTPLLGLFPSLARLGVGAEGSLTIDIGGDLAQPSATVSSPGLDFEVAGSRYRLEQTDVTLEGTDLTVAAQVSGVSPLTGRLAVAGGARLSLAPVSLNGVQVNFNGSADVAGVGVIEDLAGAITKDGTADLAITANGRLGGGNLAVSGSLLPLNLRASGKGLTVSFTPLLVSNALVDADLTLVEEPGGVALGGSLTASEVIVDPSVRPPASQAPTASSQAPEPGANALAGLRFADLAIRAPQRVLLTINLASVEAALDLVLSGNAAAPRPVGTASTLRGNLRFSGRDFTIDHAVATWGAGTGLYPALDVAAHTEFDKSRVVSADNRVSFVVPREGQSFVVNLAFTGQMVAAPADEGGFRFDLQPRVSSDARIEVEGDGTGSGVRSFTEAELLSLITLGRFELNAGLIGTGGLGQAVAQGALDTAVDLLVVSELANAIRQALGLDVVEIRTSALSSLFDASEQPFGVSLRVGGYLNPDLFASYRIGTYDGPDRTFSVTNEVLLSYGLGPLDLDLTGRIDFPAAGVPDAPRPELGVSLSYSFGPTFGLDAGVALSTDRSAFQVGVTLRW